MLSVFVTESAVTAVIFKTTFITPRLLRPDFLLRIWVKCDGQSLECLITKLKWKCCGLWQNQCENVKIGEPYCFLFLGCEKSESCAVLISPSERLLLFLRPYLYSYIYSLYFAGISLWWMGQPGITLVIKLVLGALNWGELLKEWMDILLLFTECRTPGCTS